MEYSLFSRDHCSKQMSELYRVKPGIIFPKFGRLCLSKSSLERMLSLRNRHVAVQGPGTGKRESEGRCRLFSAHLPKSRGDVEIEILCLPRNPMALTFPGYDSRTVKHSPASRLFGTILRGFPNQILRELPSRPLRVHCSKLHPAKAQRQQLGRPPGCEPGAPAREEGGFKGLHLLTAPLSPSSSAAGKP